MRWLTLLVLLAGCASDPAPPPEAEASEPLCESGTTRACTGPAACRGGQQCADDGESWSSCDCGKGGSSNAAGAGGESGAAGSAGDGGAGGIAPNPKVGAICVGEPKECAYLTPVAFCFEADAKVQTQGKCTIKCYDQASTAQCVAFGGECKKSPIDTFQLCWPPDGLIP